MGSLLDSLLQDVRYALRALRASPSFALVTVLSLALGIGANTAIFSLVNSVLLKTLPVQEPERLVVLATVNRGNRPNTSWTNPIWEHVRDHQQIFEGALAWGGTRLNLSQGGETRFVPGILASGGFFEVLRLPALVGRTFTRADDRRGCGKDGPLAVISYGFWQSQYGGAADALGKQLLLDGHAFTVIGVTPPQFFGLSVGQSFDVAMPICAEAVLRGPETSLDQRSHWWLTVMGRLKPGQTITQAEAATRAFQPSVREATTPADWPAEHQKDYLKDPFALTAAATGVSGLRTRYSQALFVLLGVVGLVLLVACANIANLLLARAAARAKEIAVRVSVGASRGRLLRQLLVESVLLGLLGAAAGVLLAQWSSRLIVSQLATGTSRVFLDLAVDWRVLGFTAGVGIVTGLLFGIAPALRATGKAPNETLREMSRGASRGDARVGAARFLVAVQVGLSLVILFGSALFIRTYTGLVKLDPGFERANILIVNADVRGTGTANEGRLALYDQILERLRAIPGVQEAAYSVVTPISGSSWGLGIQVDGYKGDERSNSVHYNFVTPRYLETLGTPLLAGRDIDARDSSSSPKVAVVNEALVKKFFGGQNPIGLTYRTRMGSPEWKPVEIVGVVRDAKYRSLREPAPPTAYAPIAQLDRVSTSMSFSIRSAAPLASRRAGVTSAIGSVHKDIALTFRTLESQVNDSLVQERLMATLSALFGFLALAVAAVGLAGLVSYSVSRRRGEIGIRAALGATPGSLVRLVLRDVLLLTAVGLGLGAAASLASGRFVSALLFGLSADDGPTLAFMALLLAAVAVIAGYVPARRAARIDPMECLRTE